MSKRYNNRMEALEMLNNNKKSRKKFKEVFEELGARNIKLEDIANDDKLMGLKEVFEGSDLTFKEALALKAYSKAIVEGDTKAMTFVRDSSGEKPSSTIEVTQHKSPLDNMTTEELKELLAVLREVNDNGNKNDNEND